MLPVRQAVCIAMQRQDAVYGHLAMRPTMRPASSGLSMNPPYCRKLLSEVERGNYCKQCCKQKLAALQCTVVFVIRAIKTAIYYSAAYMM